MKIGYSLAGEGYLKWDVSNADGAFTGTATDIESGFVAIEYTATGEDSDGRRTDPFASVTAMLSAVSDYDLVQIDRHKAFSALADTAISKRVDKQRRDNNPPAMFVLVADKTDQSTWEIHCVNGVDENGAEVAFDATGFDSVSNYQTPHEHFDEFVPEITITGADSVSADGYASVTVTLEKGHDTELYLESVNGYLPKSRVTTSGLSATVKIGALGLDAGDTVKLKVGFKRFSGRGEKVINVTA